MLLGRPYFGRMDPEQEAKVVPGQSPARSRCQQQCLAAWARLVTQGGRAVGHPALLEEGASHWHWGEGRGGKGSQQGWVVTHRKPEFLRLLHMGTASTFPTWIMPIMQAQGHWTLLNSGPKAGCQLGRLLPRPEPMGLLTPGYPKGLGKGRTVGLPHPDLG